MSRSTLRPELFRQPVIVLAFVCGLALAANDNAPRTSGSGDRIVDVSVVGTDFRVTLASRRVLSGRELVGAQLKLVVPGGETPEDVLIDAVANDPLDPSGETLIYKMRALDPQSGRWEELCNPDAAGERWAFPLRGQWDEEGYVISDKGFTLTCGDGSLGKCVRWGYKPWKTLPDGTRLSDYHQACVRMVNANYCGNRRTTSDGMLIDYWDNLGIAQPDPDPGRAGLLFEAAWGPGGAVCVAHTRVPEHETLEGLSRDCPRLKDRLGPDKCSPATAANWKEPVLFFNRSR